MITKRSIHMYSIIIIIFEEYKGNHLANHCFAK